MLSRSKDRSIYCIECGASFLAAGHGLMASRRSDCWTDRRHQFNTAEKPSIRLLDITES